MHLRDQNWAKSYAKQALSDLNAREAVVKAGAAKCHRLHFLQMAAEKTCKAHLTLNNGHHNLRRSHAVVKDNLPVIARQFYAERSENMAIAQWELKAIKHLANEIELLAPACTHAGAREDNTEYPWEDSNGRVYTPCEYTFPNIDDGPENKTINRLIRLIREAADSFS
jgi:hypothetical protein